MQDNPIRARLLDVLVILFWGAALVDSYFQATDIPLALFEHQDQIPEWSIPIILVGAVSVPIVAGGFLFWQRRNLMEDMPLVSTYMDRWFFEGAYGYIMGRMYPIHATIASSLLIGVLGLWTTHTNFPHLASYGICAGFVLYALASLVSVGFSRRYPPQLK